MGLRLDWMRGCFFLYKDFLSFHKSQIHELIWDSKINPISSNSIVTLSIIPSPFSQQVQQSQQHHHDHQSPSILVSIHLPFCHLHNMSLPLPYHSHHVNFYDFPIHCWVARTLLGLPRSSCNVIKIVKYCLDVEIA